MKSEKKEKYFSKQKQLLSALRKNPQGVSNIELSKISLRYGGIIGTLASKGYKISSRNVGKVYFYFLDEEPAHEIKLPTAKEKVVEVMKKRGKSYEDICEMLDIFSEAGVLLRLRAGTYLNTPTSAKQQKEGMK